MFNRPKVIKIKKNDFTEWPFIPDEVEIKREDHTIVVIYDGQKYALNGVALKKYQKINKIWLDNPEIPGTKISLGEVINFSIKNLDKECKI